MSKVLKLCQTCYNNLTEEDFAKDRFKKYEGDFRYVEQDCNECPTCGGELIACNLTEAERVIIAKISDYNRDVFDAMRALKSNDPIEFALKMGEFKRLYENEQNEKRKQEEERRAKEQPKKVYNVPKCPTCGSEDIRNIGNMEKAGSILAFGILSKKINKTFKCNKCGYTW